MTKLANRLILFSIEAYLDDISEESYRYDRLLKIRTQIRGYITFHRFSNEEYEKVMKLADTEFMKNMKKVEVDRTIFAMQLLYLYTKNIPKDERANLNMNDMKIYDLNSGLVMDMLRLKNRDTEAYKRVKEIIEDTRVAAKKYYSFIEENI